jgi:hypothetical protein
MTTRRVTLHLYDLSNGMARSMSQAIIGKQLDGIWHSGIVVFGVEYFYGGGICAAPAGHAIPHLPYQEISLGETSKTQVELEFFLQSITHRFTQATYSLLRHNCNNFANEVAQFLLNGRGIPEHIIRLPQEFLSSPLGATLAPMIEQMENQMRQQLVGGGSGLNPFGHIQSTPAAISAIAANTAGNSRTLKMEGEQKLLETAVNGIPSTIMNDDLKRKILSNELDKETMVSLVDIIRKNCNVSKNPILMSFGTIARFLVARADFRKPLLEIVKDILIASIKSDNIHVVSTGLVLAVNLTASMDKDDVQTLQPCVATVLLPAIGKIDMMASSTTEAQRKIVIYTTSNLLAHVEDVHLAENLEYVQQLYALAIRALGHIANTGNDFGAIQIFGESLESASSSVLRNGREQFKPDDVDAEKVVELAEVLESKYRVVLQNTLELVLG